MTKTKGYKDIILQNPTQILNALMCQLYVERDATILQLSWVPIMSKIVAQG